MFKITWEGDKRPGGVDLIAALTQHCQPHTWVPMSRTKLKPPSPLSKQRFGTNPSAHRGSASLLPPLGQ